LGAGCKFEPVTTWYNTIFAGNYRLQFEDHDPPGPHGHTWVSNKPMQILRPDGTSCAASDDVGIVTLPIYIAAGRYLYIDTYGGGSSYLFVVDAPTCKTIWQSPDMGGYDLSRTRAGFHLPGVGWVSIGSDCLPGKISHKPSPALVVPLEDGQPPD
jgi:hypothetical protein